MIDPFEYIEYMMESYRYMTEDSEEDLGKGNVYKENYYLRDHLQIPHVQPILTKSINREKVVQFIAKFLDDHSYELSTAGPVYSFTFGDTETKFLYDLFSTSNEQLMELYNGMVAETYYGKISKVFDGLVKHAPHKILVTAMMVEAAQKGYDDIMKCGEFMWAFTEYPILYKKQWKTGVKKDVMEYTIEHLGAKFKIKQLKSLQELLEYDAHASVESQWSKLLKGVDNVYMDLMYRMRNQFKSKIKNIGREYYENDKKNASQHMKDGQFDDGSIADQEGHTTLITNIVNNTISKFISGGVNASIVKIAADANQVDKDNLQGYINQINSTKNNHLPKLIEDIITAYFTKNSTASEMQFSSEFINFGLSLYRSIGTSKDETLMEIKNILNFWMNDIIRIREFYKREATIIGYTRAIYNYIILMIIHYN